MKLNFKHTQVACYLAYVSQAIAATFLPLLFVHMEGEFSLSLKKLTFLITITFLTEIIIDSTCTPLVEKIGYRASMIIANSLSAAGLIALATLPYIINPYTGIVISCILYAIGGGFDEVLVSPIIEACPTKNKEASMGFVHAAFCFGCAIVVIFSTLFFKTIGIEKWRYLSLLWAIIPLANAILFNFVPIRTLEEEKGVGKFSTMLKNPLFWLLGVAMVCAGASELSMSQWASAFAESGLNVSKTFGDLFGPCAFAILMGSFRLVYSRLTKKIAIEKMMICGAVLCIISYLLSALSSNPVVALIGCGLCGVSVASLWPGTFSLAAKDIPNASTAMFATYALLGDLGCTCGPTLVGLISSRNDNALSSGLLFSCIFPIVMLVALISVTKIKHSKNSL